MALRSFIRKILPERLNEGIGKLMVARRERYLGRLPLHEAFDKVYERGLWKQGKSLSGVGSEGFLAERYITLVRDYAVKYDLRTVLDAGCGDFSVGSQLAANFERYTAVDVSGHIIEINKRRYSGPKWENVTFSTADLTATPFPAADLVLIRQVMQHLTNLQIEKILANLDASSWRRALITEDVYDPLRNQSSNIDLPSHSVRTRRSLGSGVFIDRPPFNREANRIATIYSTEDGRQESGGLLVIELIRGGSPSTAALQTMI
jgi:SAM-dependent methyltransferase